MSIHETPMAGESVAHAIHIDGQTDGQAGDLAKHPERRLTVPDCLVPRRGKKPQTSVLGRAAEGLGLALPGSQQSRHVSSWSGRSEVPDAMDVTGVVSPASLPVPSSSAAVAATTTA
ncbi:hypothetical protein RRG08_000089 [Elysia crispata]|uniref:Uncharacterized protein n=1 Tax=Elysia crispata TaxID=231223 RepID=A0AAE1A1I5_9GAST|nr:hypothetical protein RRG08_000089 [Elysia crispata]